MDKKRSLKMHWEKYSEETTFNFSVIHDFLEQNGETVKYEAGEILVEEGEFPSDILFIKEGIARGKRAYEDGNEYVYFQVDQSDGNLGLLEVLGRREAYISTVTSLTEMTAVKIPSYLIYQKIMNDPSLLRRCSVLLSQDLYTTSGNEGLLYRYRGIDRVRHYLIQYFDKNSGGTAAVEVKSKYQDIAFELGISVRTVGRSIQSLKNSGEIMYGKKKVMLDYPHVEKIRKNLH
ncbi:Crp/Fnr family transcriptional regulator [Corticicoccus populi]|uniref:HTH-type transcriptional regulator ArcR n=1 Tax=Corticicoccus populi TaxID=1812821 RepID=A0ABW5WSZ8_9STAP